jgi:formylglycine-generating enzyme required for sulfatase activity
MAARGQALRLAATAPLGGAVVLGAIVMWSALPARAVDAPPGPARATPPQAIAVAAGSVSTGYEEVAEVAAFNIDATEVTVGRYRECVEAGACAWQASASGAKLGSRLHDSRACNAYRTDRDDHPINCVDWHQADAYCRHRGGRLPTRAEWLLAARGPGAAAYPWGKDEPAPGRVHAVRQDGGPPRPRLTAPVGAHPAGASPAGMLGAADNVAEWMDDGRAGGLRVSCGGSFWQRAKASCTMEASTTRWSGLGFRCVGATR